jgi:hypothetical protein
MNLISKLLLNQVAPEYNLRLDKNCYYRADVYSYLCQTWHQY